MNRRIALCQILELFGSLHIEELDQERRAQYGNTRQDVVFTAEDMPQGDCGSQEVCTHLVTLRIRLHTGENVSVSQLGVLNVQDAWPVEDFRQQLGNQHLQAKFDGPQHFQELVLVVL